MTAKDIWHRLAAGAMITAPACIAVGNLTGVNQNGTDSATLEWVGNHPGQYFAATAVFLAGMGLLLPAGLRMAGALTDRGSRLGLAGGVFVVIGWVASLITLSTYLLSARLITLPGVDPAVALTIKVKGDEDGGLGLFILLSLFAYVGFLLLAVGLVRARMLPRWAGSAIAFAMVALVVVDVVGAATVVVVLLSLVLLAGFCEAARRSTTEWQQSAGATSAGLPSAGLKETR